MIYQNLIIIDRLSFFQCFLRTTISRFIIPTIPNPLHIKPIQNNLVPITTFQITMRTAISIKIAMH